MALRFGLADAALKAARDHLQQIKDGSVDRRALAPGFEFLVRLLIYTGEIDEARELVQQPEGRQLLKASQDTLPVPPYYADEWYSLLVSAAAGDYDSADETLKGLVENLPLIRFGNLETPQNISVLVPAALADGLLFKANSAGRVNSLLSRWMYECRSLGLIRTPVPTYEQAMQRTLELLARQADMQTARGWLALESGDTETAQRELSTVVARALRPYSMLNAFRARPLAEMLLGWVESNQRH
jgi:hypothetical protein